MNDFTILKRIVMWISLGNKEERESHFPPVENLGTVIPVLYSLLYFFTSLFLSLLGFIRALSLLGCDVSGSKPVVDCGEQGAALAA